VFDTLRKMSPLRQIEAAELVVGHNNFSRAFVMAMLAATPESKLVQGKRKSKTTTSAVTREQVSRLERELASLQLQTKGFEETYGLDNLHLRSPRPTSPNCWPTSEPSAGSPKTNLNIWANFNQSPSSPVCLPRSAPRRNRGPGPFQRRDRRRSRRVGRTKGSGGNGGKPVRSPLGRSS
jgi:hypothetical protein